MPSAHTPCRARACHGSPQPCPPIQHPRAPPPPNPQPSTTACVSRSAATSAAPSAASWSEAAAPCFYSAKRPCSDSLRAVQLHRSFQPTAQPALCALCHPCALRFSPRQQAFVISWRHASNDSLQYSKVRQEFGAGWEEWGAHASAGVGAHKMSTARNHWHCYNIAAQIKGVSSVAKVGRIRLGVVLSLRDNRSIRKLRPAAATRPGQDRPGCRPAGLSSAGARHWRPSAVATSPAPPARA